MVTCKASDESTHIAEQSPYTVADVESAVGNPQATDNPVIWKGTLTLGLACERQNTRHRSTESCSSGAKARPPKRANIRNVPGNTDVIRPSFKDTQRVWYKVLPCSSALGNSAHLFGRG